MSHFRTIKSKILVLLVLGITIILLNAGADRYKNRLKDNNVKLSTQSHETQLYVLESLRAEEQFINRHDPEIIKEIDKSNKLLLDTMQKLRNSSQDVQITKIAEELIKKQNEHQQLFQTISANQETMDTARKGLNTNVTLGNGSLRKIVDTIAEEQTNKIMQGEDLSPAESTLRDLVKDFLITVNVKSQNLQDLLVSGDDKQYEQTRQSVAKRVKLEKSNIDTTFKGSATLSKYQPSWNSAIELIEKADKDEQTIYSAWQKRNELSAQLSAAVNKVKGLAESISDTVEKNTAKYDRIANWVGLSATGAGALLFILLGLFIVRATQKSLNHIIENLGELSRVVAGAAEQVSTASNAVAEGASEQAASIEETSSSLEEMSSMTKQNADNANQANNLMAEASKVVELANGSMAELTVSMQEVSKASQETSKIIKTIDEIAFQTNLLALNAAVEAARAGEAGAGFAVVADEVRNLALRAAEAAKNTASLIEGTVIKVKSGAELVGRTNQAFGQVTTSTSRVAELVGEIAAASSEQAQGIDQVNKATAQMDKVTQQNAANAEESASASQEMNAQAVQLRGMVADLAKLVRKQKDAKAGGEQTVRPGSGKKTKTPLPYHASSSRTHREITATASGAKELTPEQVIPMEEGDFRDF